MPKREPEFYQRKGDGLWDWRLRAENGAIIATSGGQGYTERNDAEEGWKRVVEHASEILEKLEEPTDG